MKKQLFIILLCLLGLNGIAQLPPSGTVTLVKIEPDHICPGDSFKVHFKFKWSGINDTIVPWYFHFWRPAFSFMGFWFPKYTEFYHQTKNLVGSDTIYTHTGYCPSTYTIGPALICINGQYSCINIEIVICDYVGIKELNESEQAPIYFDLYGNIIDPRKGEIMIEKVGNRRRKVIIN